MTLRLHVIRYLHQQKFDIGLMLFCSGAVSSGSNATRHQQHEDGASFFQAPTGPKYDPLRAAAAAGRTSLDSIGTTNMSGSVRASLDTVADGPKQKEEAVEGGDINEVHRNLAS